MRNEKPVIGMCGGIGSGKSEVARLFAELGCLVIDSDELNHRVLRRNEVLETLVSWWGADVRGADGSPNRSRIAEVIFGDDVEKRRLESLVYPLIADLRRDMIRQGKQDPSINAIILDSPLLFESCLDRDCDAVVFVEADEEHRIERLKESRGWTPDELRRRERWQMPLSEKRARSDFVIRNQGAVGQLRPQIQDVLRRVMEHAG